jgi:excisionase family DNA binding protein
MERLLTQSELAERLGTSERFLEVRRVTGGGPPYVKVGRAVRYRPSAVDAWIQQRERTSTSDSGPRDD